MYHHPGARGEARKPSVEEGDGNFYDTDDGIEKNLANATQLYWLASWYLVWHRSEKAISTERYVSKSAYVISYICFPPPPSTVIAKTIEHQLSTFKF